MKNQLQNTTIFVVMMLLILGTSLYLLDTPSSNQLTSAAVANQIDCTQQLAENASVQEKEMYNNICGSKE